MSGKANNRSDRKIVIERTYEASIEDVWELWATREGIESWWGPGRIFGEGSRTRSEAGGQMVYAMTAVDRPQVEFMKKAGMPLTTEARLTYTEIVAGKTIGYTHRADFIPGVEPYNVANKVEFFAAGANVRMVVTLEPMHSDEWTQRSVMGMESQLGKLAGIIARRGGK
jgi:uncharacterized protein YndB with AHSA1/START domain